MNTTTVFKILVPFVAFSMLAGCVGGGGGTTGVSSGSGSGSGTSAGTGGSSGSGSGAGSATSVSFADYQTNYTRVSGQAPAAVPTSVSGTYNGAMRGTVANASGVSSGEIISDLNLTVNWSENGFNLYPITGTASNFRGTTDGGTTVVPIGGQLTAGGTGALPTSITRNATTVSLPGGGTAARTVGDVSIPLSGSLTLGGDTVATRYILGGQFVGAGTDAIAGTWSGGVTPGTPTPTSGILSGGFATGTYYVEK